MFNLYRVEKLLKNETSLPHDIVDQVLSRIRKSLPALGLNKPAPSLVIHWLTGILAEMGYSTEDLPFQSLELSLENIEMNIRNPSGHGVGNDRTQSPQASSIKIAENVKKQVALRRVFQPSVVAAHVEGLIELDHLGSVDRPHDIFLTPESIKLFGLPPYTHAPQAGPAKKAEVLLSHLIRFTHELQNHFAGVIHWGFVNTLLTPYFKGQPPSFFRQFAQQLLFEFAQLDVGHGGISRRVVLDFDFEVPAYLESVPAIGPSGQLCGENYSDFAPELKRFNQAIIDVLEHGDYRGSPFHAPHLVFHLNQSEAKWNTLKQKLFKISYSTGNPSIALSFNHRCFGPIGVLDLKDPDTIQRLQSPSTFRGFSLSSLSLNLPRLVLESSEGGFEGFCDRLNQAMEIALSAHREKRIFISNLMARGTAGPHQFLRLKQAEKPFLKLGQGSLGTSLVGLAEAAALFIGTSHPGPVELTRTASRIIEVVRTKLDDLSRLHKMKMILSSPFNEEVAFRFALMDLKKFGRKSADYILRSPDQTEPVYSTGTDILFDRKMPWEKRMKLEASLQVHLNGEQAHTLFYRHNEAEDEAFFQHLYNFMKKEHVSKLQLAPDMRICLSCGYVARSSQLDICSFCHGVQLSDFGWAQSSFSPVAYWNRGKKEEWNMRHRFDDIDLPTQEILPLF